MGMRSPHEATAEASRPFVCTSSHVQGRTMSSINAFSEICVRSHGGLRRGGLHSRSAFHSGRRTVVLLIAISLMQLAAAPASAQAPETPPLILEGKIALGHVKGRIDHMAFDPLRGRLFVAELENNSLGVVDLAQRKVVHVIAVITEPQG